MMEESDFLNQFKRELTSNLPGEISHLKMSPFNRPLSSIALKKAENFRESAVAVVLFRTNNSIECILTQRSDYDGSHGGQVSFPGGKKDDSDVNLEETSRRECFEEIGVSVNKEDLLGQLTNVFIPVSQFLVSPFVYYLGTKPTFQKNEREVAEILTFPLFNLKDEKIISTTEIHLTNGTIYRDIPYFDLANKKVWGATALILSEIREILFALN